jgi:demethylmenaquinone methyltransferase / 2-methoxy-6-polyprenyl-1,4-benzoquinol methylase
VHAGADDHDQTSVRAVFAGVARRYDLANHLLSGFLDTRWRRRMVAWVAPSPGERILDVACGTGTLTLELARALGSDGQVVGLDFCEEMLAMARARCMPGSAGGPMAKVQWRAGDAQRAGLPDAAFDAATCAFGVRNMMDRLPAVLAEMRRVLRPGGRVGILEFSLPRRRLLRWAEQVWLAAFVPLIGGCLTGRFGPYRYLTRTIRAWDRHVDLSAELRAAGFVDVVAQPMHGGIVTLHRARRA